MTRHTMFHPVLAALVVLFIFAGRPSAEIIQQVLVKVNGDILTSTELEKRQVLLLRARGVRPADDAELQRMLSEMTPDLLVEVVNEMLLVSRAKELGYKMTDEDFSRVVTRIREENKIESDEAFQAALKQEGMTMQDLRDSLERQMLIARVQQQEVMAKVGITEEEARKYHAEHLDEFTLPGAVTLREILVGVPQDEKGVNVGLEEEAREKAEAARKRALDGEAFEQVAAEVSTSATRANGGLVGPLDPSELSQSLQDMLKTMKPGDISEARRVPAGFQIVKLETMEPERVLTPEEARDRIADALYEEKRMVELRKYLAKQRAQAIIEWKNADLKKAWEKGLADRAESTDAPESPSEGAPAGETTPGEPAPAEAKPGS